MGILQDKNHTARDAEAAVIGMPNPASKFCVDKGGKICY